MGTTPRSRGSSKPGRIPIALECSVCSSRNYKTTKAPRQGAAPLALKKFCKVCNAHTMHREAR